MKYRTWLLEALRLHFEEKLPRIEAGRRLGIPKSTACDLFVRFRQAGLSWPLPPRINAKNLDKRLYRQDSQKSSVLPVAPASVETPVVSRRPRRPNFPREFKIALVEQSMQPGVSVAQLARANNINDNLLFNWRRLYQPGCLQFAGQGIPERADGWKMKRQRLSPAWTTRLNDVPVVRLK